MASQRGLAWARSPRRRKCKAIQRFYGVQKNVDGILHAVVDWSSWLATLDPAVREKTEERVRQRRERRKQPASREAYFNALLTTVLERVERKNAA